MIFNLYSVVPSAGLGFHLSAIIICTQEENISVTLARRDVYFVASILTYNLSFCEAFDILFVPVFSEVHASSYGH